MPDYRITNHAEVRMSQRAVRDEDIALVLTCGTQIGPSEWFMRDSDVKREVENMKRTFQQVGRTLKGGKQRFERPLKRKIQRLERLRGLMVAVVGDKLPTCYWPSVANLKKRRARRNGRTAR